MEEDKYFKVRMQEIETTAGRMKDEFIDEMLRIMNKFTRDWTELLQKKGQITAEQQKSDKLNVA
jgi:hypothetical protein